MRPIWASVQMFCISLMMLLLRLTWFFLLSEDFNYTLKAIECKYCP